MEGFIETASLDIQTFKLSGDVSKFYACHVVSWMNEQQSQKFFLKVDPVATIRNNKLTS